MAEFKLNQDKYKNDAPRLAWHQVWTMALTKPSLATFEIILSDPQASRQRAFNWIFITGTLATLLGSLISFANPVYTQTYGGFNLGSLACWTLLGGPVLLLWFVLTAGVIQFIAKGLEGDGSYGDFFYAASAFSAPLMLISIALAPFNLSGSVAFTLLNGVLTVYQVILIGIALRAVNGFAWGRAVGTLVLAAVAAFFVLLAIMLTVSLVVSSASSLR